MKLRDIGINTTNTAMDKAELAFMTNQYIAELDAILDRWEAKRASS